MFQIISTLKKALKVEKPSENDKDLANNILTWDSFDVINNYPNEVLRAISNSPTASACMSTKTDYIRGGGFNIPDIENIKVNKDEKFNSFHNALAETANKLKGIAIHVQRDIEGNIVQLTKVPFEDLRLGIPDDNDNVNYVVYNPRWQQRDFKISENVRYDLYTNSKEVYQKRLQEHLKAETGEKYKGEIYWNCLKKDGFPYYPYPFSEYDLRAFQTDSAFTNFDYNNIKNNFFLGGVINIYGDPNEEIYEPLPKTKKDGTEYIDKKFIGTRGEIFNREMQEEFGGDDNTGKFMVNWMKTEAEKIDIEAFPTNTNSDLFQQTQARIWNKISHITKVPTILANIETAGKLGASQEILNAIQLMNNSVNIQQSLLEEAYNILLPQHVAFRGLLSEPIKIKKLNPVSFIPDKVWDAVPDEIKLNYIAENYNIKIDTVSNEEEIEEQKVVSRFGEFGVGGVQGILAIQNAIATGVASYDAGLATLKIIYGFTDQNARKILGNNAKEVVNPDGTTEPVKPTNDNITNLTGRQLQNIQRIVRKFKKEELTFDQASIMLKDGFGFNDEQVKVWLDDIEGNEEFNEIEE